MPANWLAFAREDLNAAELLAQGGYYPIACFHCQQAVEKALKAFLLHNGQPPPHIHRLDDLLSRCAVYENALLFYQGDCATLDQYYMLPRYPDAAAMSSAGLPDQATTQRMLGIARAILTDIETRIFPPPPPAPAP